MIRHKTLEENLVEVIIEGLDMEGIVDEATRSKRIEEALRYLEQDQKRKEEIRKWVFGVLDASILLGNVFVLWRADELGCSGSQIVKSVREFCFRRRLD